MNKIQHLSAEERRHYLQCDCGDYVDMRNLDEIIKHQHWMNAVNPTWNYSVKIGEPAAYTKEGKKIELN